MAERRISRWRHSNIENPQSQNATRYVSQTALTGSYPSHLMTKVTSIWAQDINQMCGQIIWSLSTTRTMVLCVIIFSKENSLSFCRRTVALSCEHWSKCQLGMVGARGTLVWSSKFVDPQNNKNQNLLHPSSKQACHSHSLQAIRRCMWIRIWM